MSLFFIGVRKIRSFVRIPLSDKLLFGEAFLLSAYVKCTLLFLPFSKVKRWLGRPATVSEESGFEGNKDLAVKVRNAVKLCGKYAPWPTECYTRALTAKIMLKRRNVGGTLNFGFYRKQDGEMLAHAWLQSSGILITGFCDFSKYETHSSFK